MTARPDARERLAWGATYGAAVLAVLAFHARAAAPGMAFSGWDLRYFFYGVREVTAAALRHGHLPGWQRGMFLGYPLVADPQAAVLDPATWLTLPWDAPRALTLATLLHLATAACGMVFWMRVRGLRPAAGLLAAVLFALGAKQTVHLQHWNFAASTAWWPWMLAGLDGFAERGRGRWLLLTTAAAALSWLGGAPQMSYFGTLVAGAYALVLSPRLWRRRGLDALLALASAPAGLLLAGPVILPVMELARLGPRGVGVDYRFVTSWKWPDRWALALFVLPRTFVARGAWAVDMNLWEATGYVGVLPLALAATAPLGRRATWLFLVLGIVGVWLGFGSDAWLGLHRFLAWALPGYGSFRNPTRSLMVTSLAAALLSAEALDALVRDPRARWRRALVVLGGVAVAAVVLPRLPAFPLDRDAAGRGAWVAVAIAAASAAWLAAGNLVARRPHGRAAWALVAAAIAGADLYAAFGTMNEVTPAAWQGPALGDLGPLVPPAPEPRRVAVLAAWGATANAPLRRGWEGTTGYGPTMIQRVRWLLESTRTDTVARPPPIHEDIDFPRGRPASALWPLLASPLVVSDEPLPLRALARLRPEYGDPDRADGTAAYAASALPRVFWTPAWVTAADDAITAPLLRAARGEHAVLAPDAPLAAFPPPGMTGPLVAAERVSVEGGTIGAVVVAPAPGVAVILDPWFPGWRAEVDGRDVPIARADYAFMAVPVPAGHHRIQLTYRNEQVGRGLLVATATLAALVAMLAVRRRVAGGPTGG